jgi:hypothetical protein
MRTELCARVFPMAEHLISFSRGLHAGALIDQVRPESAWL